VIPVASCCSQTVALVRTGIHTAARMCPPHPSACDFRFNLQIQLLNTEAFQQTITTGI